jgi:hypothetical protein
MARAHPHQHQPSERLPTPTPTDVRHNPSADEFALWCAHPVTRWVAKAYALGIAANERLWESALRDGSPTAEHLNMLRKEIHTRVDAYEAFLQSTYANYLATVDPETFKENY